MRSLLATILLAGYQASEENVQRLINFFKSNGEQGSEALRAVGCQDKDMLSSVLSMAEAGDIVNIERYSAQGTKKVDPNQTIVSAANRHGQIINVSSSQSKFSFGFNFVDVNVINKVGGKSSIGAPRIFNVTGHNGEFYEGISSLQNISAGTTMEFQFVVHPALGQYIYSAEYKVIRALIERCSAEEAFHRAEIKRIKESLGHIKEPWSSETEGEIREATFTEFKMEIDLILGATTYDPLAPDKYNKFTLKTYENRASQLNNLKKKLCFIQRMIECAFCQNKQKPPAGSQWLNVKAAKQRITRIECTIDGVAMRYTEREVTKKI